MANGCASAAFRQVARVFQDGTLAGMSDGEILGQFVACRDEAAFELLLRRHGPMVRNVCRQTVFDPHEAEDAFQATFLALVCKASTLRVEASVGPWLYRVASRISGRARANRRRRSEREVLGESVPEPTSRDDPDRGEVPRVVHEELGRLPERLRAPMVLCYLEGMTHELAARQLSCPVGTVRSRLARARALLHKRITRRGLMIPAATLAALLESTSRAAALPAHITRCTIKVAAEFASRSASIRGGMGVSASVATLLEGVLKVMRVKKLASLAAAFVAMGTLAAVVGVAPWHAAGQTGDDLDTRSRTSDGRTMGPDGRPIGSLREKPAPATYVKTYYVGDLIMPPAPRPQELPMEAKSDPAITERRKVDMGPIIDLITSTVARGSWSIQDGQGIEITLGNPLKRSRKKDASSSSAAIITPFYLSISVIVRSTADVHDEVANLLRGLRRLQEARENTVARVNPEPNEEKLGSTSHPADTRPAVPRSITRKAVGPPPAEKKVLRPQYAPAVAQPEDAPTVADVNRRRRRDQKTRIQQLLDELRQEVEKLPQDHD